MKKLVPITNRPHDVSYKMQEIIRVLGYSQRFVDSLTDIEVHGIYHTRVLGSKRKSKRSKGSGQRRLQTLVHEAILRDEVNVRQRAGLL